MSTVFSFAKSTPAIEEGFLAAGITAAVVASIESLVTVLSWLG